MSAVEPGVFATDQIDHLVSFYEVNGRATLRCAFYESTLADAEDELVEARHLRAEGRLDARHGAGHCRRRTGHTALPQGQLARRDEAG